MKKRGNVSWVLPLLVVFVLFLVAWSFMGQMNSTGMAVGDNWIKEIYSPNDNSVFSGTPFELTVQCASGLLSDWDEVSVYSDVSGKILKYDSLGEPSPRDLRKIYDFNLSETDSLIPLTPESGVYHFACAFTEGQGLAKETWLTENRTFFFLTEGVEIFYDSDGTYVINVVEDSSIVVDLVNDLKLDDAFYVVDEYGNFEKPNKFEIHSADEEISVEMISNTEMNLTVENSNSEIVFEAFYQSISALSDPVIVNVTLENDCPTYDEGLIEGGFKVSIGNTLDLDFDEIFSDEEGDELIYNWTGSSRLDIEVDDDYETLEISPADDDWVGDTSFDLNVSDGNCTENVTIDIEIVLENRAPEIISGSPVGDEVSLDVGRSQVFSIEKSDADEDDLSVSWKVNNKLQSGAKGDSFSFIATETGNYNIYVQVFDGEYSVAKTWSVLVGDGSGDSGSSGSQTNQGSSGSNNLNPQDDNSGESREWIIGVIVGGVLLLVLIVVIVLVFVLKRRVDDSLDYA